MDLFLILPLCITAFEAKSSKFGSIPNTSWMSPLGSYPLILLAFAGPGGAGGSILGWCWVGLSCAKAVAVCWGWTGEGPHTPVSSGLVAEGT